MPANMRDNPPPYLPPRRPSTSSRHSSIAQGPPSYLPPRRPVSVPNFETAQWASQELQRLAQGGETIPSRARSFRNPSLPKLAEEGAQEPQKVPAVPPIRPASSLLPRAMSHRSKLARTAALRQLENRLSEDSLRYATYSEDPSNTSTPAPSLMDEKFDPDSDAKESRPAAEITRSLKDNFTRLSTATRPFSTNGMPTAHSMPVMATQQTQPRPTLSTYASLENIMAYRDKRESWRRSAAALSLSGGEYDSAPRTRPSSRQGDEAMLESSIVNQQSTDVQDLSAAERGSSTSDSDSTERPPFRYPFSEPGFCFTIAMTQLLAEYLISGFAVILPQIASKNDAGGMGLFWPASLLSLILSATLLTFARLSDMYGGYYAFQFGTIWLFIWTLIPGFFHDQSTMLDISRAMQGLALAAFPTSVMAMVGSTYPDGQRKTFVLSLYSACAPIGFFVGFLVGGALPPTETRWYFWIAAILSGITAVSAYFTVPHDKTNRLTVRMDWPGAGLITAGLILLSYGLSVVPYVNDGDPSRTGWSFPSVYGPLSAGLVSLLVAFWYEGWVAACPLIPFDFFKPRSVKGFCLACLFFYGAFGVWLYNSAELFHSQTATGVKGGIHGILLALWYTPTAIGGVFFCIAMAWILKKGSIWYILLFSGTAWVAAPLILALAPLPLNYWSSVLTSTLCATIGLDMTFTVSLIWLSSVQPETYQGFAGAVCSILINLAMSFSLSISEIVLTAAQDTVEVQPTPDLLADPSGISNKLASQLNWGFKVTFLYGAASAAVGVIIILLFVRMKDAKEDEGEEGVEMRPSCDSRPSTLVNQSERLEV